MSQVPLAPPPQEGKNPSLDRWLYLLWRRLTQAGQILWSSLSFGGSNLTDLEVRNHADLQNLNTATHSHLTAVQVTGLTDGGISSLHNHATYVTALEAGETLTAGAPVKVVSNKLYAASHVSDPLVLGILRADVTLGQSGTVVLSGLVALTGLTPESPYFLGVGVISTSAPASGYVTRIGRALSTSTLLVEVEDPILLA